MIKAIIYILPFFFGPVQDNPLQHIRTFQTDNKEAFRADKIGSLYTYNASTIKKLTNNRAQAMEYTDAYAGEISTIDVTDPFKILVHFSDYNSVLFLDRFLAPIGDMIELDQIGIFQPVDIASSSKEGFWILNSQSNALELYNNNLVKAFSSRRLNGLLKKAINNYEIIESDQYVLVYSRFEVLLFDLMGNYIKTISTSLQGQPIIVKRTMYYIVDHKLNAYHMDYLSTQSYTLPNPDSGSVRLSADKCLIATEKGVAIYQLK